MPAGTRTVQLTAVGGTSDIATGATLSLGAVYPLGTPDAV
jgi:hypothetical protein